MESELDFLLIDLMWSTQKDKHLSCLVTIVLQISNEHTKKKNPHTHYVSIKWLLNVRKHFCNTPFFLVAECDSSDERGVKVRQLDWTTDDFLTGQFLWLNVLLQICFENLVNISNNWDVYQLYQVCKMQTAFLHCYEQKETRVNSEFVASCHIQMQIQNLAGVRTRSRTSTITPRSSSQQTVSDHEHRPF